jgi:hypothetical protein
MNQIPLPLTTEAVDFSTALHWLKAGERLRRPHWHAEVFIEIADVEYVRSGHQRKQMVIDMVRESGDYAAWTPEQVDILAIDWRLAP